MRETRLRVESIFLNTYNNYVIFDGHPKVWVKKKSSSEEGKVGARGRSVRRGRGWLEKEQQQKGRNL